MAAGVMAAMVLSSVSACQSSGSGSDGAETQSVGGSDGGKSGLPSARTMADIETFVAGRTTCTDMYLKAEEPEEESVGSEWGIKERGVCYNDKKMSIRLLVIDDMKTFQARAKERGGGYFIGEDFAVYTATSRSRQDLKDSGLLHLFCEDTADIPSGYEKEPALVDGCVLTNHIS